MKRYNQDLNDPKKMVERPHGEWVKYEDIPDAVETDRERRQATMLTKQSDIINRQSSAVKTMRKALVKIASDESLSCTGGANRIAKDAVEETRDA
jgi:hypothetical protein